MTTEPSTTAAPTTEEYILADDLEQLAEPLELMNLRSMPPGDINILRWAFIVGHNLQKTHRAVLTAVAWHANNKGDWKGYAYPSLVTIGLHADVAVPTACDVLKELALLGYLTIGKRTDEEGCKNVYRLAGLDTDWIPTAPAAGRPRPVSEQLARQLKERDAQLEARDATIATLEQLLDDAGIPHAMEPSEAPKIQPALTEGKYVSNPSSGLSDQENTHLPTQEGPSLTLTETWSGKDVVESESPPPAPHPEPTAEKVTADALIKKVEAKLHEYWEDARASKDNPKGWLMWEKAVETYVLDPDKLERDVKIWQAKREVREGKPPAAEQEEAQPRSEVTGQADPAAQAVMVEVLAILKSQVPKPSYETWLAECSGYSLSETQFVIVTKSTTTAEWLERRMYQSLHRAVETVLERNVEVVLAIRAQADEVS